MVGIVVDQVSRNSACDQHEDLEIVICNFAYGRLLTSTTII